MDEISELHKEIFGVYPVVLGLHTNAYNRILDALDGDEPYDESKELPKEDIDRLKEGQLLT